MPLKNIPADQSGDWPEFSVDVDGDGDVRFTGNYGDVNFIISYAQACALVLVLGQALLHFDHSHGYKQRPPREVMKKD